jgi:uncharacterized Zn finger protein
MDSKIFMVQGSAPEPYRVHFIKRTDTNLSAYCNCPAGLNGQYCKHRFNILNGSTKGIVSDNLDDVEIVKSWLPGSDIEAAMNEVTRLEAELAKMKKVLSLAKKNVAHAMRD